jgi:hypothetical protein
MKISKIAIGVGLASGALLAAWLLTGTRKDKTKKFISKGTASLMNSIKKPDNSGNESDTETHYV